MAYDKYSTEKVFKNDLANILCNKVLDHIHTQFAGSEIKLVAMFGRFCQRIGSLNVDGNALFDDRVMELRKFLMVIKAEAEHPRAVPLCLQHSSVGGCDSCD
jgi:hypothetical protein